MLFAFLHFYDVHPRPDPVFVHATHEQVRNPVGNIEIVSAMGLVTGVVTEFEELFEVSMPSLEVNTARALALAALVYCDDGRIERLSARA